MSRNTDDYKTLSVEEAFREVKGGQEGLTSAEAQARAASYGYNEIKEKEANPILKVLSYFYGPMPIAIEAAAVVSALISHWDDFALIVALLLTNVIIAYWQERSAGNAIRELMRRLALKARALRDKVWVSIDAKGLVPGDIIRLRMGGHSPGRCEAGTGGFPVR